MIRGIIACINDAVVLHTILGSLTAQTQQSASARDTIAIAAKKAETATDTIYNATTTAATNAAATTALIVIFVPAI
eukprot:7465268-Ditylum_brightwellii.AAC.1